MQRKMFFLAVVLLIGSSWFLLAYAVGTAVAEQSEDYREPRSERARVSEEQRRVYGQCLSLAELARKRGRAFSASVRRSQFESDQVRQQLKNVAHRRENATSSRSFPEEFDRRAVGSQQRRNR